MARLLDGAAGPVTLVVTGPLTTVAAALDLAPSIEGKIAEFVWMGDALEVAGNVH
jgi:purine nucleosidase